MYKMEQEVHLVLIIWSSMHVQGYIISVVHFIEANWKCENFVLFTHEVHSVEVNSLPGVNKRRPLFYEYTQHPIFTEKKNIFKQFVYRLSITEILYLMMSNEMYTPPKS
jgi:hypothetical protein